MSRLSDYSMVGWVLLAVGAACVWGGFATAAAAIGFLLIGYLILGIVFDEVRRHPPAERQPRGFDVLPARPRPGQVPPGKGDRR